MQDLFSVSWQYVAQLMPVLFLKIIILVMQHVVVLMQLCF